MPVRELSASPRMRALYPLAAAGAGLSLLRRLPGVPDAPDALAADELVLREVAVDRDRLAAYDRVCTFEVGTRLPVTYPHLLAFPLSMKLMTAPSFPFALAGLVHVRNRIRQHRALGVDERLTVRVRADGLRPHDRGRQFDLLAQVEAEGETVWESASTYLHREGGGGSSGQRSDERSDPPEPIAAWTVPADIGRRYAEVSGDRNPIHLHPLSARLFGMPRHIAHGMWAKARCLAVLGDPPPGACTVDVSFKLPLLLPGRVALSAWPRDGGRCFALHDAGSGKPHLSGLIES